MALPLFGAAMGNGNTVQFSLFSGNIFNPQFSIGGNASNNTATTNLAAGNGNYSQTDIGLGLFGNFLFGGGNGNTFQLGLFVVQHLQPPVELGRRKRQQQHGYHQRFDRKWQQQRHRDNRPRRSWHRGHGHHRQRPDRPGRRRIRQHHQQPGERRSQPYRHSSTVTATSDQQTPDPVTVGSNDTDLDITALRENESSGSDLTSGETVPAGSNDNANHDNPDNQRDSRSQRPREPPTVVH